MQTRLVSSVPLKLRQKQQTDNRRTELVPSLNFEQI